MIAEEQLTEWEREAADGELRRQSAHALIAEVRRLQGELATVQVAAHAVIDTVTAERDAAFDRGWTAGREGIARYSRTVGEIEAALGIAGAVPMRDTVSAVRSVVAERDAMRAHAETLVEFAKTAPGRLPGLVQDAINAIAKLDAVKP